MEGCFLLVSRLNADIVETPTDIQLGEVLSSVELGYKFRDQKEGVFVLDHHGVECMIVLDQLERAIFLLNKEHWSCHRRFKRVNLSSIQILLQEGV